MSPMWFGASLLFGSLALIVSGVALSLAGMRGASPEAPIRPNLNWRRWPFVWRMRSRFTSDSSFRMYAWGATCLSIGALLTLAYSVFGRQ